MRMKAIVQQSCWRNTAAAKPIFVSVKHSSKNHYHTGLPFPIPQASGKAYFRSKHCFTKIKSFPSECRSLYLLYDRRHSKLKASLIHYSKKLCFKKAKEKCFPSQIFLKKLEKSGIPLPFPPIISTLPSEKSPNSKNSSWL